MEGLIETTLTAVEQHELTEHEAVIERGLKTFYEVGAALLAIRDGRLYRLAYGTFEDYCRERWGLRRSYAYELIDASKVVANLSGIPDIPRNPAQVRPLVRLEPEQQRDVWQYAVETAPNGKPTAAHVQQVAEQYQAAPAPMAVHYSSATPEWYTPRKILDPVLAFFDEIDLDPCSNSHDDPNVPARQHYTEADDGLSKPWWGRVYMNPPYGRAIGPWIEKLCDAYKSGEIEAAIALIPGRVDTDWFRRLRDYAMCVIDGRLKFVGADNSAPFPSLVVYLGDEIERFSDVFSDIGDVWIRYGSTTGDRVLTWEDA